MLILHVVIPFTGVELFLLGGFFLDGFWLLFFSLDIFGRARLAGSVGRVHIPGTRDNDYLGWVVACDFSHGIGSFN